MRTHGEVNDARDERSLRGIVNVTMAIATAMLLLAMIGGTVAYLGLNRARSELADGFAPALAEAERLRAATGDQQSGVRGYALTGDPQFLEPWHRGVEQGGAAIVALRSLLEGRADPLGQLDLVEQELREWQTEHALPLIAATGQADGPPLGAFRDSRTAFNEVRTVLDELVADLEQLSQQARQGLTDASDTLGATIAVVGVVLAALIIAVLVGLRRLVLRPVETTVRDAQLIAGGDLDHVPVSTGLAELAQLGSALDEMRVEVVAQLRAVEERERDLARSNTELEQFAYVASHDLQEPLRKVASFCQMLERRYKGQLDERADTYIGFAVDGALRMQELINDLLTYSRVGRTTERFDVVDLNAVVDAALRNLSSAIEDSGAAVHRSPMPTIVGDRTLLVALFQNLVGNGIKFRGPDAPVIEVHAVTGPEQCEFTVSDNGIGIAEEYRDRIFVIFQRLHGRDEYPGTGIGLSLCRKIVEFHGGRIEVAPRSDDEGSGTTIRFSLRTDMPLDAAPEPQDVSTR